MTHSSPTLWGMPPSHIWQELAFELVSKRYSAYNDTSFEDERLAEILSPSMAFSASHTLHTLHDHTRHLPDDGAAHVALDAQRGAVQHQLQLPPLSLALLGDEGAPHLRRAVTHRYSTGRSK